ncbi:hypothetical protein [Hymenobacter daecheongensis]|nr:hypothetical protein [Hymenobacter daecheongensis]
MDSSIKRNEQMPHPSQASQSPLVRLNYVLRQLPETTPPDLDGLLASIADLLQNKLVLCSGSYAYRVTELELYYWGPGHHDPYIHRAREQQEYGRWSFNDADCLDFTFGSKTQGTWGGVLLRGLRRLPSQQAKAGEETYIAGPRNVLRELVASLDGVFEGSQQGFYLTAAGAESLLTQTPWRVARYELRKQADDTDFLLRSYRFLVEEQYLATLKDRAQIVRQLLMPKEQAKAILGYFPTDLA